MRIILLALAALCCGCSSVPAPQASSLESAPAPAAPEAARNAGFVTLTADAQKSSGLITTVVSLQNASEVAHATARLTNDDNHTWRVGAVAEGRITRAQANPGDVVIKDQLLAQMHSHDIHESRALYKRAQAELARAKGVVDYRVGLRDRAKRLLDLRAGSVAQLEQTETELKNAQTEVHTYEIEVERTETHLTEVLGIPADESKVSQSPDGEDNDLIPIRAPAAGVVMARNVTPGTVVTPSNDLFLISDLSTLWAIAEVNEEYLHSLRTGMAVRILVQAYPGRPFVGRIGKVGDVLDPATRTVKVRIELPNPKGLLKPEMYADAEIEVGRGSPAIMVPAEAVQDVRGDPTVFVRAAPDRFEVRPVRVGRTVNETIEILSGLKPGDEVVSHSAFILKSEFLKASLSGE
ncbi:MAG: efflux RND transporter periplasmic adaptor subunit [Bryobacteraceae bacterium]